MISGDQLAKMFKRRRQELGLAQADVADEIESSQEYVSKNEREPSRNLIKAWRYFRALKIDFEADDCQGGD